MMGNIYEIKLFSDGVEPVSTTYEETIWDARRWVKKELLHRTGGAFAATIVSKNPTSFLCCYRIGRDGAEEIVFLSDAVAYSRDQCAHLKVMGPDGQVKLGSPVDTNRRLTDRRVRAERRHGRKPHA